jgi:hypothetical protein
MGIARLESRPVLLATLLTAMVLALAPAARADVGEQIILRCTHGESLAGFSQKAYDRALKELSADAEEYSPCSAQIRRAQAAAAAGGRGGAGGGPSTGAPATAATAASPAERKAVARAASAGAGAVNLGGQVIHPGVVNTGIASAFSSLPTPLLVILIFLLVCLLLVGAGTVRNRVSARHSG